jgi:hypothetical protein
VFVDFSNESQVGLGRGPDFGSGHGGRLFLLSAKEKPRPQGRGLDYSARGGGAQSR